MPEAASPPTIDQLWTLHGLDRAPSDLSTDATLTAQTLTAQTLTATHEATPAPFTPRDTSDLPVISLAMGALSGAPVLSTGHTPDLIVQRVLGEGGMGRVLLATQQSLGREVALKVLKPEVSSASTVQALLSEARIAGSLEHPNIVPIHALGLDTQGRPLLVMKRIEGVSWREVLQDPEHPAWTRLLVSTDDKLVASVQVLMAVCDAAQFAHEHGVIHRDIKPDNVMLGRWGEVYLVDWGIAARLAADTPTQLVGTPGYMAPEMLSGNVRDLDTRADVYLLGATLHEVLTGTARHAGATLYAALVSALESAPVVYGPEVQAELAALANQATHHDREERPPSAEALRVQLATWLRHRASSRLAEQTRARLSDLATAAQDAAIDALVPRLAFDRIATECRFAFAQALSTWADNPIAHEGLRTCLTQMLTVALAREHLESAEALSAELGAHAAPFAPALTALKRARAQQADEAREGAQYRREFDPSVSRRERLIVLGVGVCAALAIAGYLAAQGGASTATVKQSLAFALFSLGCIGTATWVLRAQVMASTLSRRMGAVVFLALLTITLNRALALWHGNTDLAAVLMGDLQLMGAICALSTVAIARWFVGPTLALYAGSALIVAYPAHAAQLFTLAPVLALGMAMVATRNARQRPLEAHEG
ncbi:MAG: serine/threonine-protein kinase [Deltaproteobacteria bacterium]|nr:serine/threonine-protein kinase [Deltaproteobacteria bacterium]